MAAFVGVLGSGPVNGVLLGAVMSIVLLLRQAARPRVTELARVPGTSYLAIESRHPENERTHGVLVVRCESALLYFNVEYVHDRLFEILQTRSEPMRLVVFFVGSVPRVDLAGAGLFAELLETLRARDIDFGSPARPARCATRCDERGSNRATDRSSPVGVSTRSSISLAPEFGGRLSRGQTRTGARQSIGRRHTLPWTTVAGA